MTKKWALLFRALLRDLWRMRWMVVIITALGLFLLVFAIYLSWVSGLSPVTMTRDPLATLRAPVYLGFISMIGVLFWSVGAAFCCCAWLVLRSNQIGVRLGIYYLAAACVSSLLGLDDLFQFHEVVWFDLTGLPEVLIYCVYASLLLAFVWRFRNNLVQGPIALMALGASSLGISVAIDIFIEQTNLVVFVEDAFKFFGVLFWSSFFVVSVVRDLQLRLCDNGNGI